MSTINEVWVNGERLDLDESTLILPNFQANDRAKPDSIQAIYSVEFEIPSSSRNHRILKHAAASQPAQGSAYMRVPAAVTSSGVETVPKALLYTKGYREGKFLLQLAGGNRRLIESLQHPDGSDKLLSDLDLNIHNHPWTPANIAPRLAYSFFETNGYGYEIYDRGKPLDWNKLDPYTIYPSVSAHLVYEQIIADAGFTSDSLLGEPLFAALTLPTAAPYTYPEDFTKARHLLAGFEHTGNWFRNGEFAERAPFNYVVEKPWEAGVAVTLGPAPYAYPVPTLAYYNLSVTLPAYFGCNESLPGEVSMKVAIRVNGVILLKPDGSELNDYLRIGHYEARTFNVTAPKVLLSPGDVVDVLVQGDKWPNLDGGIPLGPDSPQWYIGTRRIGGGPPFSGVEPECRFEVVLLPDFPPGGLIRLQEWLPNMKQLDFLKTIIVLLGITIDVDAYEPHLNLYPGNRLLQNIPLARNWTSKRDSFAQPGRLPERDLTYRFGSYARLNKLIWAEDETVTKGYANGSIKVVDEVLPVEYTLATLPFAATEYSPKVAGLLSILNFNRTNTTEPAEYETVQVKPRLTLRLSEPVITGQLATTPPIPITTTASGFASGENGLSLLLDNTVLSQYWKDLQAMLLQSRYLVERYRLTAADIVNLRYDIPIWDAGLGDYFCISKIVEFDASRSTEVHLVRLNAELLPPPVLPGEGLEFYPLEFGVGIGEFY